MNVSRILAAAAAVACMTPAVARAAPILVCNTGQAAGCVGVLGGNVTDPNYTIISGMIPGAAKTVIVDGFPIGPWAANDGNSRWIGPFATDDDANGPAGSYTPPPSAWRA